jgi:hypothetical protein
MTTPSLSFAASRGQLSWINVFESHRPISLLEFGIILKISALSVLRPPPRILFSPRCSTISPSLHHTHILISPPCNLPYFLPSQRNFPLSISHRPFFQYITRTIRRALRPFAVLPDLIRCARQTLSEDEQSEFVFFWNSFRLTGKRRLLSES